MAAKIQQSQTGSSYYQGPSAKALSRRPAARPRDPKQKTYIHKERILS